MLKPNQTPLYILDNNANVAYRKDQLQLIQPNEIMPNKKSIRPITKKNKTDIFIINTIIDKRKVKNKVEYLVTWKGFDVSDATWEPRTQLIEDGMIDMIKAFETEKKQKF